MVEGHAGVELPDFRTLTAELKRGTFPQSSHWVPIPDGYLTPLDSTSAASMTTRTQSVAYTSSGASTAGRSGMSTLTPETNRTPPVARIDNPAPDAEFANITVLRPGGTRQVLRQHRRPPTNNAGQEFCVAWWLRGGCFPNCGRRATHAPFADNTERARLLAYVNEHVAASAANST